MFAFLLSGSPLELGLEDSFEPLRGISYIKEAVLNGTMCVCLYIFFFLTSVLCWSDLLHFSCDSYAIQAASRMP